VKRWLNENSLSIFFFVLLLLALLGQSVAGWKDFNEDAATHHSQLLSYWRYLVSSDFGEGVMENWQSEFLQFSTFILATVWLVQKGSNESKNLEDQGQESEKKQRMKAFAEPRSPLWAKVGGVRTFLYANSLMIVMTTIFFATWLAQSLTGWNQYNDEQQEHDLAPVTWATYITRPDFWSNTFENWQSEFLAVGTMAVFTIYLRQRGSPESKPVGAPHDETASSG
jgi:preprotein translocase subunit SecG